jgi:hypothetical protein
LARRARWDDEQARGLRGGLGVGDARLDALLEVVREAASNTGHVADTTWEHALAAGWTDTELAEAFVYLGLTIYVDYFLDYAGTEIVVAADGATGSAGPRSTEPASTSRG